MSVEFLHDLFFANFRRYGNNVAVIYNQGDSAKKITYFELAEESCKISKCLGKDHEDGFIGICMEPDLSLPSVILGVLHEGLPFVFFHAHDISEDEIYLLHYLPIRWVFAKKASETTEKRAFSNYGHFVKDVNVFSGILELWSISKGEQKLSSKTDMKIAYAIQTSGSTGKPKVVQVPHKCIIPNILDLRSILNITEQSIIYLGAPMTFDPSIIELFLPFSCGASVLICPSHVKASPEMLLEILFPENQKDYCGVTILQMTPSVFSRWRLNQIQERVLSKTSSLKSLVLGGEPCPKKSVLKQWTGDGNKTQIFNIYGITEVSCWATIHCVDLSCGFSEADVADCDVPLGTPLTNTLLEIRNDNDGKINYGEGELFIGSMERICIVDDEPAEILHPPVFRATGDIVKVDKSSGRMTFVCRKNRLIKRFGHRVCLNILEKTAGMHPGVAASVCLWHENQHQLGLGVVWKDHEDVAFRSYLLQHLPKHCVPDTVVPFKSLPLTSHGKIDLEALQHVMFEEGSGLETSSVKHISLQGAFYDLWQQVLCRKPELKDTFLGAGGSSFLALQLVSNLGDIAKREVPKGMVSMLLTECKFEDICLYLEASERDLRYDNASESTESVKNAEVIVNKNRQDIPNRKRKLTAVKKLKQENCDNIMSNPSDSSPASPPSDNALIEATKLISTSCRGKSTFYLTVNNTENKMESPVNLNMKWKYNFSKCVDASPCFLKFKSKGWVIVGSHSHHLAVLEVSTGLHISSCELPDRIESSICPLPCGKFGVVGCYDGCIYCIELSTGRIEWFFKTEGMVKCTPTLCLENSAVVVGSYDNNLYCVSVKGPHLIWKTSPGSGSIFATPCVKSKIIFIGTLDGTCAAICEETGNLKWKNKLLSPIFSSPTALELSKAVLFAEVTGKVHCFLEDSGSKLWEFEASGNIFSSFSTCVNNADLSERIIFGCHDKNVYCLLCKENDTILCWKQEHDSAVYATPFISRGNGSSEPEWFFVVTATTSGTLNILAVSTGHVICSHSLPNEVFSSPVICEGNVFVGCRDNNLYCLSLQNNVVT